MLYLPLREEKVELKMKLFYFTLYVRGVYNNNKMS